MVKPPYEWPRADLENEPEVQVLVDFFRQASEQAGENVSEQLLESAARKAVYSGRVEVKRCGGRTLG